MAALDLSLVPGICYEVRWRLMDLQAPADAWIEMKVIAIEDTVKRFHSRVTCLM